MVGESDKRCHVYVSQLIEVSQRRFMWSDWSDSMSADEITEEQSHAMRFLFVIYYDNPPEWVECMLFRVTNAVVLLL